MAFVAAFLDTNLLVQFRPITEWDWRAVLNADSVEIVLLPAVMRELERMKIGDNRRLRRRAEASLALFEKLFRDSLTPEIRDQVTLRFADFEPTLDFESVGLSRSIVDDWILASLFQRSSGDDLLVSDDAVLSLKARHRAIRCVRPPHEFRLAPDEDDEVKRLKGELRAAQEKVDKRPVCGIQSIAITETGPS